ncbi:hypothetical protein L596_025360 [Steinernema carpocapsae]|uniref:Uncharacterized protein n=1 Tax=Steinernema carpocapsae TaxID=34508 RepID=A0A4U5M8E1_STECR|nr:hypothetical protein L596_025360 [Steinernema carpocapsae]
MCSLLKLGVKAMTFVAALVSLLLTLSGLAIFHRWNLSYLTEKPWELTESTLFCITVSTYGFLFLGVCASASAICGLFKKQSEQVLAFSIYLALVILFALFGVWLCASLHNYASAEPTMPANVREQLIKAAHNFGTVFISTAVLGSFASLASIVTEQILQKEAEEDHYC